MTPATILDVRPDWNESFDNPPSLVVLVDCFPRDTDLQWEERSGLYLGRAGALCRFFSWSGKPDQGFGGWRRNITMLDGSVREIVGGWHCSTAPFTDAYPVEDAFIDAAGTDSREDFARGYTMISCGLRVEALVDWWIVARPDWGLALVQRHGRKLVVEPMRDRSVKCFSSPVNVVARLLPREPGAAPDAKIDANSREYFLRSIEKARLTASRMDKA